MRRATRGAVLALTAIAGCGPRPYPPPAEHRVPKVEPPPAVALDDGALDAIRAQEAQCRARLESRTVEAALRALDRARTALGAGCEVTTVGRDPLHWALACRSDALFESGSYALSATKRACPDLGGGFADPFECVGALLQHLWDIRLDAEAQARVTIGAKAETPAQRPTASPPAPRSALESMEIAVVGHVDLQPIRAAGDAHDCAQLRKAFAYAPEVPWRPLSPDAPEEERLYANNQLAWCRAAETTARLRAGMQRAQRAGRGQKAQAAFAIAGAGVSWLRSRPEGRCPGHGRSYEDEPQCAEARRVDLLVRFVPRARALRSRCDGPTDSLAGALYCLEQCARQAAVGARPHGVKSTASASAAPLFLRRESERTALPSGFYLKLVDTEPKLTLDLDRLCATLGIAPTQC